MVPMQNENAVSPVIAVILMVGITVIIAAIVAAFVFGMSKDIPDQKIVTATVSHVDSSHVIVTYQGGPDADVCTGVRWMVTRADGSFLSSAMMGSTSSSVTHLATGKTKTFAVNWAGKKRVLATAYFSDDTQQIILDNTF